METLWRIIVGLAAIWLLVAGGLLFLRHTSATPEKFEAYLVAHPVDGLAAEDREGVISEAARMLNSLTYQQRQILRENRVIRRFVQQLTPDERASFISRTLPVGLRQLIAELNRMEPIERKRMAQRLLRQLRDNSPTAADVLSEEDIQTIASRGFEAFYRDAKPAVREDFEPLMAEIERASKGIK